MHVPRPRGTHVPRPRLQAALRRAAEAGLTLVSAPPGFGKTTLLVDWLAGAPGADRRAAWLSLDPADDDPVTFWSNVVAALRTVLPDVGAGALAALESAMAPTELVVTALLNDLASAPVLPGGIWLVLDDYHVVQDRDVRDGVGLLLEHLPAQVHVVLSSRADPDLPLARWRARGELVEIRAADLRFTPEEAAAYLNEVAGLGLAPEDVATLERRTEGWIAALQLAALSIRGRDDAAGFVTRFAGTDRFIVDYLVEEVLERQPEPVRRFLLHTAVLDRLGASLCDAVTGGAEAAGTLLSLERANLFVVPLDDGREWYRYHHLFADVVRARLLAEEPGLVPQLHQRASAWYERHGLTEDAVRHSLAARDVDRAAYLMELALPSIRRHRHEARLLKWSAELPDDAIRRSPVLSVFAGSMRLAVGDVDGVESRLDDAEQALAAGPGESAPAWADTEELRSLPATIAVYRAALAQARGDAASTARYGRRALDLTGPDDHLARGSAAGFIGLAAWAQGDVTAALATFGQAVASLHAAGHLVDELSSTVVLADLWLVAGRPSRAARLCHSALRQAQAQGDPLARAAADLHVALGEIDYEAGDLEGASRHLEAAAELDERVVMNESRYRWYAAKSRVVAAAGDLEGAVELLDQAERLYRRGFFPDVRPVAAMRARVWIAHGDLARAADWAAERGLSAMDEAQYLREFEHLTLVRLVLARHRADPDPAALGTAADLTARLSEAAATSGRAGSLLEIRALTALVEDAQGHRARALATLGQALAQAPEPEASVRIFLDEGVPMLQLLRQAQAETVPGEPGSRNAARRNTALGAHACRLLTIGAAGVGDAAAGAARSADARPADARAGSQPADRLSDRELEVLRLLDTELSGPQIARELFVSQNTLRTHTKHIFSKLQVTSRRAAVRQARERGLL